MIYINSLNLLSPHGLCDMFSHNVFHIWCQLKHLYLFCFTFFCSGSRNTKTFKPKKHIPEGTHQYELMRHAAVTLGSGDLRQAVLLPEGEDLNEWVAVNSKRVFFCSCIQFELYIFSVSSTILSRWVLRRILSEPKGSQNLNPCPGPQNNGP